MPTAKVRLASFYISRFFSRADSPREEAVSPVFLSEDKRVFRLANHLSVPHPGDCALGSDFSFLLLESSLLLVASAFLRHSGQFFALAISLFL